MSASPGPKARCPRRVLVVHNSYQQRGGEDVVVATERRLLEERGHPVRSYNPTNQPPEGVLGSVRTGLGSIWAREVQEELSDIFREFEPEVVHVHNTWATISPAVFWTAKAHGVPTVMTLHNYRIMCPDARFLRNGRPCELCKSKPFAYPGVFFGCYRGSRAQTAVMAAAYGVHRLLGTWSRRIDRYIALSEFAKRKFVEAGLPGDRIEVKPNCVYPDPGPGRGDGYGMFVGRLSEEKGIQMLVAALRRLEDRTPFPFLIVGDGPLRYVVERLAGDSPQVRLLGWQPHDRVLELMREASFVAVPSTCFEGGLPLSIIEAFACGTCVVASRIGATAEGVVDGETGLLVEPGDPLALETAVRRLIDDADLRARLRRNARSHYERYYAPDATYERLLAIYSGAAAAATG